MVHLLDRLDYFGWKQYIREYRQGEDALFHHLRLLNRTVTNSSSSRFLPAVYLHSKALPSPIEDRVSYAFRRVAYVRIMRCQRPIARDIVEQLQLGCSSRQY